MASEILMPRMEIHARGGRRDKRELASWLLHNLIYHFGAKDPDHSFHNVLERGSEEEIERATARLVAYTLKARWARDSQEHNDKALRQAQQEWENDPSYGAWVERYEAEMFEEQLLQEGG